MRGREGDAAPDAPVVEQSEGAKGAEDDAGEEAERDEGDARAYLQCCGAEDGDANERAREAAQDLEEKQRRRGANDDCDGDGPDEEVSV